MYTYDKYKAKELYQYVRQFIEENAEATGDLHHPYKLGHERYEEFVSECINIMTELKIVWAGKALEWTPRPSCVVLDKDNECIDIPSHGYFIPLDDIKCRADIIQWIDHLIEKAWVDDEIIEDFIKVSCAHIGVGVYPNYKTNGKDNGNKRDTISPSVRYDVMLRDKFRCQLCGRDQTDGIKLHIDHIYPVVLGGESNMVNLRTLCNECNHGKSYKVER